MPLDLKAHLAKGLPSIPREGLLQALSNVLEGIGPRPSLHRVTALREGIEHFDSLKFAGRQPVILTDDFDFVVIPRDELEQKLGVQLPDEFFA